MVNIPAGHILTQSGPGPCFSRLCGFGQQSQFSDKRCELNEKGRIPKNSLKRETISLIKSCLQKGVAALYIVEPQRGKQSKINPNLEILNID